MELFKACEERNLNKLRHLLASKTDTSVRNDDGSTALHIAARQGHTEAVKILLFAGVDPSAQNTRSLTPLHEAAGYGHAEPLTSLLRAGGDAMARGSRGQTALHLAARHGHTEAVRVLVEAMEDTTSQDVEGNTALHLAILHHHDEAVPLLVKTSGIALALANNDGKMPADIISLNLLGDLLDNWVLHAASKQQQDKWRNIYDSLYSLQHDSGLHKAREERLCLLSQVNWCHSLLKTLREQCGLTEEAVHWLWSHIKQEQAHLQCCLVVHPADAMLARCLSETEHSELGASLRELLKRKQEYWPLIWKMSDGLLNPTTSISHIVPKTASFHNPIESYPVSTPFYGNALIINNIEFQPNSDGEDMTRGGAELDEASMQQVLKEIGFDIEVRSNLDSNQMVCEIENFAKHEKQSKADALVLVLFTHGNTDGLLGTDTKPVKSEDIIDIFNNIRSPKLLGKPKWLILAGCRGDHKSKPVWVSDSSPNRKISPSKPHRYVPEVSDIYITYPALPGCVAWRRSDIGTRMVQSLCRNLGQHWQSLSLHDIHQLVHKDICSRTDQDACQTVETSQRGWMKKLYFYKGLEATQTGTGHTRTQAGTHAKQSIVRSRSDRR